MCDILCVTHKLVQCRLTRRRPGNVQSGKATMKKMAARTFEFPRQNVVQNRNNPRTLPTPLHPVLSTTSARPSHSVYVPPRTHHPPILPSRSVYCYERLNQIEEGSYGVVFRARDKQSGDIVALKKLKLDEEKNGFPITALREVYSLMSCRHENVVGIREVVVGDTLTQCVLTQFPTTTMYPLLVIKGFCRHGFY
jgi:hypothetical protein